MQNTMTMQEAARYLGVSRTKLWSLVRDGVLAATPNPLDKRQKLISTEAVRRLRDGGETTPRKRKLPKSIGMYDGPVYVHGDQVKEYLREHWYADWSRSTPPR